MKRPIIFVAIVTLVSAFCAFVLAMLTAGAINPPNPVPIGMALGFAVGLIYLLLANNRNVAVAAPDVRQAALDAPPPTDGTARLIVVRQSRMGMMVGVDISIDGTTITQLKSPRFAILSIAPGRREVVAAAQGKPSKPQTVEVAAGEIVVLRVATGFAGVKITPEADGPQLRSALARVPMVAPTRT
ncbi:hypothetical protein QLH51_17880 [Sphingomonas sp. 2R-10]|uniref:hypothetical protein n=1 Tax=Sphingomonas sp. 2R-10 TaxID=3045148 RepID=UPI000F795F89|nr:hypothetical protein [Sphingomonas sp. 2R-10]MDJ0278666.1 hypothetical protein [Sphingomonas sp. 2R-10]